MAKWRECHELQKFTKIFAPSHQSINQQKRDTQDRTNGIGWRPQDTLLFFVIRYNLIVRNDARFPQLNTDCNLDSGAMWKQHPMVMSRTWYLNWSIAILNPQETRRFISDTEGWVVVEWVTQEAFQNRPKFHQGPDMIWFYRRTGAKRSGCKAGRNSLVPSVQAGQICRDKSAYEERIPRLWNFVSLSV